MGTRQYIGARYVPKFASPIEWDNKRIYEALEMVTHLNNTYTSKKPVPVGVDISNTDYWVITGNYNAQVEEYRQEVEELKKQVGVMPVLNVKNYGAKGDGNTDDSGAFINAVNDASYGQTVYVPYGVYLLDNIVPTGKNIVWEIATGTTFKGVGAGNPDNWEGIFASPLNNKGNVVSGKKGVFNLSEIVSPLSNAVCAICEELSDEVGVDYISVTGTIANGSSTLTLNSVEGVEIGDGILLITPTNPSWPSGDVPANTMRVRDVNRVNNTVTIGKDAGGGRTNEPFVWTSGDITNGAFTIRKRRWYVLQYQGASTGEDDNPDKVYYIYNSTANVTGSAAVNMELDMNIIGNPSQDSIALFIAGAGNGNGKTIAIATRKFEGKNWTYGCNIRNSDTGVTVNAKTPIKIETVFDNVETGETETIKNGIQFDNFIDTNQIHKALITGKQLTDDANAIAIARFSDSAPNGAYLFCAGADGVTPVAVIRADGSIGCKSIDTAAFLYTQDAVQGEKTETQEYIPITVNGKTKYIKLYE